MKRARGLPSDSAMAAEKVREMLDYDPVFGQFLRKVTTGGRFGGHAGTSPGYVNDQGYLLISVSSKQYRAHRLAWLYMTGEWPEGEVDHRNGERADNRWENLRDVTSVVNSQNLQKAHSNSKTGLLGASWSARDRRFVARIRVGKKYRSLGGFDTAEQAHAAYVSAKRALHPGCTI